MKSLTSLLLASYWALFCISNVSSLNMSGSCIISIMPLLIAASGATKKKSWALSAPPRAITIPAPIVFPPEPNPIFSRSWLIWFMPREPIIAPAARAASNLALVGLLNKTSSMFPFWKASSIFIICLRAVFILEICSLLIKFSCSINLTKEASLLVMFGSLVKRVSNIVLASNFMPSFPERVVA